MLRTNLVILAGLVAAALVASQLERLEAMGVLGGYLLGAAISLLGVAWQVHVARYRPRKAMQATVESFLLQLGSLLASGLILRFSSTLSAHADWRSFLLAFCCAAFLCLVVGSLDVSRLLVTPRSSKPGLSNPGSAPAMSPATHEGQPS